MRSSEVQKLTNTLFKGTLVRPIPRLWRRYLLLATSHPVRRGSARVLRRQPSIYSPIRPEVNLSGPCSMFLFILMYNCSGLFPYDDHAAGPDKRTQEMERHWLNFLAMTSGLHLKHLYHLHCHDIPHVRLAHFSEPESRGQSGQRLGNNFVDKA